MDKAELILEQNLYFEMLYESGLRYLAKLKCVFIMQSVYTSRAIELWEHHTENQGQGLVVASLVPIQEGS